MTTRAADVALFTPAFTIGGVERMRLNIAQGLLDEGLTVDIVCLQATGPLLSEVPEGARIVDLKAPRMVQALPALRRYFRGPTAPRAFLSALDYANLVALLARRAAGRGPRVYIGTHKVLSVATRESTLFREKHIMPPLLRRTYPWADGIVAVSDGIADDLASYLGLDRDRITVINNPALTDKVLRLAAAPSGHPWLDDPAQAKHTLVSVGRLDRQKDFPTLMRAVARARATRPLRCVIVGEGGSRPDLEAIRADLGLEDAVDLPGFAKNPWAFMARAAAFVSSSAWEGFGNVHVEALGVGCPVISTDSPSGPADILKNGEIGPLVEIGDDAALAQAILDTLANPKPKALLQARGRDFHVSQVIKTYRQLMQV